MIRFRFREDEQRYLRLLSETYRAVAQLPPEANRVALRNLGKIHDMLLLEGIRQGVAAAAVANLKTRLGHGQLEHLKAFQLHATIYGSQDTPLRSMEEEWVRDRLQGGAPELDSPWLDPEPMRFAPDTEQSAMAAQAMTPTEEAYDKIVSETLADRLEDDPIHVVPDLFHMQHDGMEDSDEDFEATVEAILAVGEATDSQERPDLLDRIRSVLLGMAKDGVRPRDWQDLILRLHMTLHIDAGFLDIQLGTPMGRTVLTQAGFFDLHPGPLGTNLTEIKAAAQDMSPTPSEEEE